MIPSNIVTRKTAPHAPSESIARVFVVDYDISVRESLESLIRSAGWHAETFASAHEFLARQSAAAPSCLVLDVSLPDVNGLDVQTRVASEGASLPIIFITGHEDIPTAVRAMKAGAVEFLTKPLRDDALLDAIANALEVSRAQFRRDAQLAELRGRYESLTPREVQVLALVVAGRLNKQVAAELGIAEITVKAHRGKVTHKMKARSLADLVKMAAKVGIGA
ncbi:MAG: response regulator transcription factor [Burkholderiales bacterium]